MYVVIAFSLGALLLAIVSKVMNDTAGNVLAVLMILAGFVYLWSDRSEK